MALPQGQYRKANYFGPMIKFRTKCELINQHQPSTMSRNVVITKLYVKLYIAL